MNRGLRQLTERVFYLPHEEPADRPVLGYIRGERYSLAVDAGNSRRHVEKFYAALDAAELRRPDFTVLTHWHVWPSCGGRRGHRVRGHERNAMQGFTLEVERRSHAGTPADG